jgi:hypothetical protein
MPGTSREPLLSLAVRVRSASRDRSDADIRWHYIFGGGVLGVSGWCLSLA